MKVWLTRDKGDKRHGVWCRKPRWMIFPFSPLNTKGWFSKNSLIGYLKNESVEKYFKVNLKGGSRSIRAFEITIKAVGK